MLDTITSVENSIGKDMFNVGGQKEEKIAKWMACLVVAATVQFHLNCDKLAPYFREEWSRNIENIETCQNAPELLEKITKHAAHNNLEMDFKNTPVNPSGPNNWQTTKDEPNKEEGAEKTVKAGLRGKLKSSQH